MTNWKQTISILVVGLMFVGLAGRVSAEEVHVSVSSDVESTSSKSVSSSVSVKSTGSGTSVKVDGKEVTEDSDTVEDGVRKKISVTRSYVEEKKESVVNAANDKKEQVKEMVEEKKSEVVSNLLSRIIARLRAATNRFESILDRMEGRSEKLADKGAKTKSVDADIRDLKDQNENIRDDITTLESDAEEATASSFTELDFSDIRESVISIQKKLQEIHKGLINVVADMVDLSKDL